MGCAGGCASHAVQQCTRTPVSLLLALAAAAALGCVAKQGGAMQGLEVYSTVLWHMKREVEVSYLAQEAIAQDRRSPHAWAIMGNCFSLQKVTTALCCSPMGNFSPFKRYTLPFVTAWWAILTGSLWCELLVLGSLRICLAAVMLVLLYMTAFAFLALPYVALLTR